MVYRKITLICGCGRRFSARDERGKLRNGRATVRELLEVGVVQHCPDCKKEWKGTIPKPKQTTRQRWQGKGGYMAKRGTIKVGTIDDLNELQRKQRRPAILKTDGVHCSKSGKKGYDRRDNKRAVADNY